MKILEVDLPKKVVIGDEALSKLGDVCRELDLKGSVKIFTDKSIMDAYGKNVIELLQSYDYKVNTIIIPKKIRMEELELNGCDFTMGLGGGRSIDAAKMAAKKSNVPFISVPTAISHDGIASNRAVIDVYSMPAVDPTAVVIDMQVILKSPYRLIASGCGDAIAKFTAVADWELSHTRTGEYISEYAAAINKTSAELILNSATSIRNMEKKGIRNLVEALVFSGISMSIAGSSRPASGSEHLFSHALKEIYPQRTSLHGEECGLGTILCSYFHEMDWERIVKALNVMGCPTNNEKIKIPKETIIDALYRAKSLRKDRYTILNYKDVDKVKAKEAARDTGVI
ncbi:MAG: iron-containing alcohol dehydrogenase [Candidatus Aenigmarchaeota archaeon]|nr:iron-containing alcohol dehydrogenase [Candidatus Aenigmarchaeota archaeon]